MHAYVRCLTSCRTGRGDGKLLGLGENAGVFWVSGLQIELVAITMDASVIIHMEDGSERTQVIRRFGG